MTRRLLILLLSTGLVAGWGYRAWSNPMPDFQSLPGPERVAAARKARGAITEERFKKAGVHYPPSEIFFRGFKQERLLEVWARDKNEPFRLVTTYPVLAGSGDLGPKRQEGDLQMPEGFYRVAVFNPESRFHLSLGLDYPNASDLVLSNKEAPGSEIYIHGNEVSVGCLAMGDDAMEEIYLMSADARAQGQTTIEVHLFPARMQGADWEKLEREYTAERPELAKFWSGLQQGYLVFEKSHRLPVVRVDSDGQYRVE